MSYPPQEIIDQMNEGRDFVWDIQKEYIKDGTIYKELKCGCIFANTLKDFGFSNHFCDKHAPCHAYQTPINQEDEK